MSLYYRSKLERTICMPESVIAVFETFNKIVCYYFIIGLPLLKFTQKNYLKIWKTYDYHIQQIQRLHLKDGIPQIQFGRWIENNVQFYWALYTDEAQFTRDE